MCSSVSECTQASSETSVPLDLTAHDEHVIAVREELNMDLFFFFLPTADVTDGTRSHGNFTFTDLLIWQCLGKKSCEPEDFDGQLVACVDGS